MEQHHKIYRSRLIYLDHTNSLEIEILQKIFHEYSPCWILPLYIAEKEQSRKKYRQISSLQPPSISRSIHHPRWRRKFTTITITPTSNLLELRRGNYLLRPGGGRGEFARLEWRLETRVLIHDLSAVGLAMEEDGKEVHHRWIECWNVGLKFAIAIPRLSSSLPVKCTVCNGEVDSAVAIHRQCLSSIEVTRLLWFSSSLPYLALLIAILNIFI